MLVPTREIVHVNSAGISLSPSLFVPRREDELGGQLFTWKKTSGSTSPAVKDAASSAEGMGLGSADPHPHCLLWRREKEREEVEEEAESQPVPFWVRLALCVVLPLCGSPLSLLSALRIACFL